MKQKQPTNSLRYRLSRYIGRTKCMLLNRRGDGVHSPYAFRFIRQVLRNPHPYTAFNQLRTIHRERKSELRYTTNHHSIASRRFLECIFRLAADHQSRHVCLLTSTSSLIPTYIAQAIPSAEFITREDGSRYPSTEVLRIAELIIIEDATQEELTTLIEALKNRNKAERAHFLVLNTYNPALRAASKHLRKELRADIEFDLKGLEIWVWRTGITPGRYSVYC